MKKFLQILFSTKRDVIIFFVLLVAIGGYALPKANGMLGARTSVINSASYLDIDGDLTVGGDVDVTGTSDLDGDVTLGDGMTLGSVYRTTWPTGAGDGAFIDTGTTAYYNGGNVGIGDDTPTDAKLKIVQSSDEKALRVDGTNPTSDNVFIKGNQTSGHTLDVQSTGILAGNGNVFRVYTNAVQQSGIGIARLWMDNSDSTGSVLTVTNDGTGASIHEDKNNSGISHNIDGNANSASDLIGLLVDVVNSGAGEAYAAIFSNGNVGIGGSTPTKKLEVEGSVSIGNYNDTTGIEIGISDYGGASSMVELGGFNSSQVFVPTVSIDPRNGNVGIGDTTPAVKLEVTGIIKSTPTASEVCDADSEGGIYYDSDDNHFYGCNGSVWVQLDN